MALYVDSAYLPDVAEVCAAYPVSGVTTNPTILLGAYQRGQRQSAMEVLAELLRLAPGTIFMQPEGETAEELRAAAERYIAVDPARVVPKLPATHAGFEAGRALKREGARISLTACYSLAQTYCGAMLGADWVIPYFGRMRRSGVDACERVAQMAALLSSQGAPSRILAASIKTTADLVEVTLAGAHDATVTPDVIRHLPEDAMTHQAVAQFAADSLLLRELEG